MRIRSAVRSFLVVLFAGGFLLILLITSLAPSPRNPAGKAPLQILIDGFRAPTGVAIGPDGTLFFTDNKEGRLFRLLDPLGPEETLTVLYDHFKKPRGLVHGEVGTLYVVADEIKGHGKGPRPKGLLLRWHPDDAAVTIVASDFKKPQQLAWDQSGRLLVSTQGGVRYHSDRRDQDEKDDEDDEDDEDEKGEEVEKDEHNDSNDGVRGFPGTVFRVTPENGQIVDAYSGFRRPSGVWGDDDTITVAAMKFRQDDPPLTGSLFQLDSAAAPSILFGERFQHPTGIIQDALGQFYLSVKRDPDHPKDGGLLLKVAPDGTFTRFAQGFRHPWGLAFDVAGNLYVSDPKAGKIYRFLAPAAPVLATLPETTTEAQVALSGTTEPEAQITVRGGSEEVHVLADTEGNFLLDVPLTPDQADELRVYATGAKGEGLTSAPALATILQQTTPPPPSVSIALSITEPSSGDTITSDAVLVRGLVDAGGLEVGVTVNDFPGAVIGNTFAALVPVTPGTTTLIAFATTASGASATQSIDIAVGAPPTPGIILVANPAGGVAPLTVGFSILGGPAPTTVELDLDGDGTIDFTGPTLEQQTFNYAKPDLYSPKVKMIDADGNALTASTVVQVYDQVALDAQLQAKWTGMKDALRVGDVAHAVSFLHSDTRAAYQAQLSRFSPGTLANIDRWMTTIQLVEVGPGGAQYEVLRDRNGQMLSFAVWFQLDQDGIWRLRRF